MKFYSHLEFKLIKLIFKTSSKNLKTMDYSYFQLIIVLTK